MIILLKVFYSYCFVLQRWQFFKEFFILTPHLAGINKMCTFQCRCCSISMPRYLALLETLIFWSPVHRKLRYLVICFHLDLNIIISVLSAFRLILFDLSHWTMSARETERQRDRERQRETDRETEREIMICVFLDFFHRLICI